MLLKLLEELKSKATEEILLPVTPTSKPRMTQRDKWSNRPSVVRYWKFKDEIRVTLPDYYELHSSLFVEFVLPMPKSWSKKKKREYAGKLHKQKPDTDNLMKAFKDALLDEDKGVSVELGIKRWSDDIDDSEGHIIIYDYE